MIENKEILKNLKSISDYITDLEIENINLKKTSNSILAKLNKKFTTKEIGKKVSLVDIVFKWDELRGKDSNERISCFDFFLRDNKLTKEDMQLDS